MFVPLIHGIGMNTVEEIKKSLSEKGMTDAIDVIDQVLLKQKFRRQNWTEICVECGLHMIRECSCTEWKNQYFGWLGEQRREF